ncbi:MAG: acyl-CoA dehydrogenase, partial [Myxococcales bacterium]|nr:acyl-CoA dehydrogenase [Myxococcales bacterium]
MRDGGWVAMTKDPQYAGQGLPEVLGTVFNEVCSASSSVLSLLTLLTRGACDLIRAFGTDELKARYCEKMFSGVWAGTMCLTEPHAGSALADIKTIAHPEGDHYKLKGNKCFITFGDHDLTENIVHLVLARTPDAPEGTRGISLFVVPKYRVDPDGSLGALNDATVGGVEHKMGIHGSPTCVMNFGDDDDCIGHLVGELHQGLPQMFKLMNEARMEVGQQALGLGAAAYQAALGYAKERVQGKDILEKDGPNVLIVQHPDVKRNLVMMKALVEGLRALNYACSYYLDKSHHAADDHERQLAKGHVALLTPICKAYSSDMAFRVTELAIQVHGGYGYIKEYGVEQYCRDVKICSLYEGTNGIQALDLLGRKVLSRDGLLFKNYLAVIDRFIKNTEGFDDELKQLNAARDALVEVTMSLARHAGGPNARYAFLSATPYLALMSGVVAAQLLLEQAVIAQRGLEGLRGDQELETLLAQSSDAAYYHNKVLTARFFVSQILPESLAHAQAILSGDRSALELRF